MPDTQADGEGVYEGKWTLFCETQEAHSLETRETKETEVAIRVQVRLGWRFLSFERFRRFVHVPLVVLGFWMLRWSIYL